MNQAPHKAGRVFYWTLHGRLTPDNRFEHKPAILTPHPPRKSNADGASRLRIELLDAKDQLLLSQTVPVAHYCPDGPQTHKDIAVRAKVPLHERTVSIRFWNGDVLVKEWKRPDKAPVLANLKLSRKKGKVVLTWQAHHPDGHDMQYIVRHSQNGGRTFNRLSCRLNQPGYEVTEDHLPGGKDWVFQVAATDGVNTTTLETDPLDLPETSPLVEISHPPDGHQAAFGARLLFHGDFIAFIGQKVGIGSVLWTSDIDGTLSDRLVFETDQMSRGSHLVILSVVDDRKRKLTDSISLEVT